MKFYQRQSINKNDPMNNSFAVEADGRIVTNKTSSIKIPAGTIDQRPSVLKSGEMRYNLDVTQGGEFEVYINDKWEIVKTNRQALTHVQQFNGNYADSYFGPLMWNVNVSYPQNVFVYVDNVFQIPQVNSVQGNYILQYSSSLSPITKISTLRNVADINTTTLYLTNVADFKPEFLITGNNIQNSCTIVSSNAQDNTITISTGTSGIISSGTQITVSYKQGTYVRFQSDNIPVPNKPVTIILGLDGYCPPFEVQ